MKPSFAIVGCGKVGTALGINLSKAGYRLAGLSCRAEESAKKAAEITGAEEYSHIPWDITKNVDIIFITTPDGVITEVCGEIARNGGLSEASIVLHCSGSHPSTILSPARETGASIGSMHPLQSFAAADHARNSFEGIIVSTEGDTEAVNISKEMAKDLGATCITIKTEAKTLYHASAVVACNYLVTLQDFAVRLMEAAGISGKEAFQVLKPLVMGTLSNIEKAGTVKALTGPIARGDVETVKTHVNDIRSLEPDLIALYNTLGLHTITIAEAGGTLSEEAAGELRQILSGKE